MSTRRNKIVSRITELENIIKSSNEEITTLTNELQTVPGDLLDRDDDAVRDEAIRAKNQFLRDAGLIP